MKNKAYETFDDAVADIPDGSTIMFPGFGGVSLLDSGVLRSGW